MTFFIIIGAVGFLMLIFSMFTGGDDYGVDGDAGGDGSSHDAGHGDGAPVFSFRTIVSFLAAFGAAGAISSYYGLSTILSALIGLGAGFLFGLFAWWLVNLAFKQQASSLVTSADLIGLTALVITPILEGKLGEISVDAKGQRKAYAARSVDGKFIAENSAVKILEDHGVFVIVGLV